MSSFYGPENPHPCAALTERRLDQLPLCPDPERPDLFNFGPLYNARLAMEIGKLTEVDCDSRVCYVGPTKGAALRQLIAGLGLVRPIIHLVPETTLNDPRDIPDKEEKDEDDEWRIRRVNNRSAEEYFDNWYPGDGRFDAIIMRDAHDLFKTPREVYLAARKALTPGRGRLLVVHRPAGASPLPDRTVATAAVARQSSSVRAVLDELREDHPELDWQILHIPMVIGKTKWLSMVYHRYPVHLRDATDAQVSSALRELVDGPFKYCGPSFECEDALLFACISSPGRPNLDGTINRRQADYFSGRHRKTATELTRGFETCLSKRPPPTATGPRLAVAEERFPLVQRCMVQFEHDLNAIYRT